MHKAVGAPHLSNISAPPRCRFLVRRILTLMTDGGDECKCLVRRLFTVIDGTDEYLSRVSATGCNQATIESHCAGGAAVQVADSKVAYLVQRAKLVQLAISAMRHAYYAPTAVHGDKDGNGDDEESESESLHCGRTLDILLMPGMPCLPSNVVRWLIALEKGDMIPVWSGERAKPVAREPCKLAKLGAKRAAPGRSGEEGGQPRRPIKPAARGAMLPDADSSDEEGAQPKRPIKPAARGAKRAAPGRSGEEGGQPRRPIKPAARGAMLPDADSSDEEGAQPKRPIKPAARGAKRAAPGRSGEEGAQPRRPIKPAARGAKRAAPGSSDEPAARGARRPDADSSDEEGAQPKRPIKPAARGAKRAAPGRSGEEGAQPRRPIKPAVRGARLPDADSSDEPAASRARLPDADSSDEEGAQLGVAAEPAARGARRPDADSSDEEASRNDRVACDLILPRKMVEAVIAGELPGLGVDALCGCIFRCTSGDEGYILAQCTGVPKQRRNGVVALAHGWTSRPHSDTITELQCISNQAATTAEIACLESALRQGGLAFEGSNNYDAAKHIRSAYTMRHTVDTAQPRG